MFTIIAYQEALGAAERVANLTGVPDQHVRVDGDIIYMADFNQIIGVLAGGSALMTEAYLASPSLRRLANYQICPLFLADEVTGFGRYLLHPESPLSLEKNEGLEAVVTVTADSSLDRCIVGVALSDGPISPITGEIFHVRATATLPAATSGAWQNAEMTFDQTLPVGRYAIVGACVHNVDGMLFRFVPIGESFRPGGVCVVALDMVANRLQRNGGLGVWCEFDQITPPSIEVLTSVTATATATCIVLDLIKVG